MVLTVQRWNSGIKKPKLLDELRIVLRANHYSRKTEEIYLGWIKRYILFHNKRHSNAGTEFGLQYSFPANKFIHDKESGLKFS